MRGKTWDLSRSASEFGLKGDGPLQGRIGHDYTMKGAAAFSRPFP